MPVDAQLLKALGRIAPTDIRRAARDAAGSEASEGLVDAYADVATVLLSCAVDLALRVAPVERLTLRVREHGMWAALMADLGSHASLQPPFAALGRVAEAVGIGAGERAEAVRAMAMSLFVGANDLISHHR